MDAEKEFTPLRWLEDRLPSGELDASKPPFAFLYEDLCEQLSPGIVERPSGSVKTEVSLFDYVRTETRELLLYRWTQTVEVVGLAFPTRTTRYSAAIFEKNAIAEIVPLRALKGQAVAFWIRKKISPIGKLQERGWL